MNRRSFLQLLGVSTLPLLSPAGALAAGRAKAKVPGPGKSIPNGNWTIVVLPDTQKYTFEYPEVFMRQTEWIAAHRQARNIQFVLHEGDITDRNSHPEWLNARRAMDVLKRAKVPFVMVPGNHDLGEWGSSRNRRSFMSDYFTLADCAGSKERGFFEPGKIENTWQTFETPWGPFLVLALEYYPRDAVLEWAGKATADHPDHQAILLTHSYLYSDSTRYDWAEKQAAQRWGVGTYGLAKEAGGANDGEQMWRKLVSQHRNFLLTLNGHVLNDGTGYLKSTGVHGNTVHQMLANFQSGVEPDRGPGGGGYLRLLEFQADRQTIQISSYSPWFDHWLTDSDQKYTVSVV